jgi:hypothetical protein
LNDCETGRVPGKIQVLMPEDKQMPVKKNPIPQQEFLRDAMERLDMTRQQFADRLDTSKRRLDNWLLPTESDEFRKLDPTIWLFIREIIETHKKG